MELPDCFFTCKFLEEFKCTCQSSLPIFAPEFTRLGRLKMLSLYDFQIGNSVEIFISGYPVLEDLELHLCIFFALDIVSHKLRRLLIEDCSIEGHMMWFLVRTSKVFKYLDDCIILEGGSSSLELILEHLSSLVKALVVFNECGCCQWNWYH